MQRSLAMNLQRQTQMMMAKRFKEPCDVFLNHRCMDTKKTVATLLYDHLFRHGFNPFLDNKNMKPGDKLFDKINGAVMECKIGVAIFSPRYCESYFCLHELALLMGCRKKIIPIFCDVKPSQLRVLNNRKWSEEELRRFRWALEETKSTVGLTFNSSKGYI
ncbi:putative TIR domain-containing protein [Lupinus albus]|uniref:Putative TIR domain-containing protein n=1 Tax=Lupinus albus TaxID=3870 RepID=A0A6A4N468_LUPAL|nr:putative TIR domain-containing protein [Lupinus albus]